MGTCPWGFILVTVALLLDPTSADVLVQPNYAQPKDSVAQSQTLKSQPTVDSQQKYSPNQHSSMQLLQQQHVLQQQYLKQQHQHEQNHLLQMQHHQKQQLQNLGQMQYHQKPGNEVVGSVLGVPYSPLLYGPYGANGGKFFSLGPLGLHSLRLGGLGGLGHLLLSPHQPTQVTGSNQFQKSADGPTKPRTKRDVRDPGDSTGKKYRQKLRTQHDGVAENSPLKSKSDATPTSSQSSKTKDPVVGDANKQTNDENVGSSGSLLDPLGLMDKAEDLIDDLKDGRLPNPMNLLHAGHLPGHLDWLRKSNSEIPKIDEHVVAQAQPYNAYTTPDQLYNQYTMQGRQGSQYLQSPAGPIVGDARHLSYLHPQGGGGSPSFYGNSPSPYPSHGQLWNRQHNSMGYQGDGMSYRSGNPIIGANNPSSYHQPNSQMSWAAPTSFNPITGAPNPNIRNPPTEKLYAPNSNGYQQMTSSQNPITAKTQSMTDQTNGAEQLSSPKSMTEDPVVEASNPSQLSTLGNSWGTPSSPIVGAPNPTDILSQMATVAQPFLGPLLNPMTGNARSFGQTPGGPGAMVGNPLINSFYNSGYRTNYYDDDIPFDGYGFNGQPLRHRPNFGFDNLFDGGYNHQYNGGFDRIYDDFYDDNPPFAYGGGYPYHVHHHQFF